MDRQSLVVLDGTNREQLAVKKQNLEWIHVRVDGGTLFNQTGYVRADYVEYVRDIVEDPGPGDPELPEPPEGFISIETHMDLMQRLDNYWMSHLVAYKQKVREEARFAREYADHQDRLAESELFNPTGFEQEERIKAAISDV
jgi:hypothetical protein